MLKVLAAAAAAEKVDLALKIPMAEVAARSLRSTVGTRKKSPNCPPPSRRRSRRQTGSCTYYRYDDLIGSNRFFGLFLFNHSASVVVLSASSNEQRTQKL